MKCTSGDSPRALPAVSRSPGTYLGVIEKIPYLKSLGVTAVELMPIHEFPILDIYGQQPERRELLGLRLDGLLLAAPRLHGGRQAGRPGPAVQGDGPRPARSRHRSHSGCRVQPHLRRQRTGPDPELQRAGEQASTTCSTIGGHYKNFSGCGNTVNGNHPIVREMIFHCLRHWVHNYHVDGFRFDLASILSRNRKGELVPNPPMVEVIAEDPMLADTKIIAEAWDAAGAYQVGSFANQRWAEWNGRYRDDIRRFWRGDPGMTGPLATRLAGSSDLYQTERPPPVSQHQLHHVPRRLSDQRPGQLREEAQRRQRRRESRRRQQQLQQQLRHRGSHPTEGDRRSPPPPGQEHARHADAQPGCSDDDLGR